MPATPGATLGRPASQLPVRPALQHAADVSSAGQSWDSSPVVSRAVTIDELEVTPEPSPASAESGAAAAGSGSTAGSGSAAAAGGGGSGAAAGTASPTSEAARDQETQAWADRLYDRISLRLRRDLLVERERSGALVDRGF
jgi:hypothetical protein